MDTCNCLFLCSEMKCRCLLMSLYCVYIEGKPGVGKSTLVQSHFRNVYVVSETGKFFMNNFDDSYDCIVFDEFELENFPRVVLYRLLDGLPVQLPQKHSTALLYERKVPVFFLCNFHLPCDEAFRRRVYYYYMNYHELECTGC